MANVIALLYTKAQSGWVHEVLPSLIYFFAVRATHLKFLTINKNKHGHFIVRLTERE